MSSSRVRADHVRELARQARDARTHQILIDIALELEAEAAGEETGNGEPAPQPAPRSLS